MKNKTKCKHEIRVGISYNDVSARIVKGKLIYEAPEASDYEVTDAYCDLCGKEFKFSDFEAIEPTKTGANDKNFENGIIQGRKESYEELYHSLMPILLKLKKKTFAKKLFMVCPNCNGHGCEYCAGTGREEI